MPQLVRTREDRVALAELDEEVAHALIVDMDRYAQRYGRVSASALLLSDILVGEFRPLAVESR